MIEFTRWNKMRCGPVKFVYSLVSGLLFVFLMTQFAAASNYYSKQYGLPCSKCHDKIPTLKEFGSSFKSNGYSLEKKVVNPINALVKAGIPAVETQLPSGAKVQDATSEKNKDAAALNVPEASLPTATEYLFRGQAEDGTYYFSDHPPKGYEITDDNKKNSVVSKKNYKSAAIARKSALSMKILKKHHKDAIALKGIAKRVDGYGKILAPTQQPSVMVDVPPRNFEECMGAILIKMDEPKNGSETMIQFEAAEQICAPHAAIR